MNTPLPACWMYGMPGVPIMAQWVKDPTCLLKICVQSPALLNGLRIQCCPNLWHRPAAAALIRPPAWELPYATSKAVKGKKKKKKKMYGIHFDSLLNNSGWSNLNCFPLGNKYHSHKVLLEVPTFTNSILYELWVQYFKNKANSGWLYLKFGD